MLRAEAAARGSALPWGGHSARRATILKFALGLPNVSRCPAQPLRDLSPPTNTPRPALNALAPISPEPAADQAAERTARNLHICDELIELGARLARIAAARAESDMAAPPPTKPIPCSAAAALENAEEAARRRGPNYGRLFTHLTRAIGQTMLLQNYLTEGAKRARYATPQAPANDTPTRDFKRDTPTHQAPRRDMLRRDTLERLDCELPITPTGDAPVEHLPEATRPAFAAPEPDAPPGTHPPEKPARHTGRRW